MPDDRLQKTREAYRSNWADAVEGILPVGETFTMVGRYIVNPDPQCRHNWHYNVETDSAVCLECHGEILESEFRRLGYAWS